MTPRSPGDWTRQRGLWGSGEGGTAEDRLEGLRDRPRSGRPRRFPPEQVAAVKAAACEMLIRYGLPVSRFSGAELHRLVIELAVNEASASTIWRSLPGDALKPWRQRSGGVTTAGSVRRVCST